MTPRLAVTQEQVDRWDVLYDGARTDRPIREVRARLPERPTMPCQLCDGGDLYESTLTGVTIRRCPNCDSLGSVPIPEGTEVRIEYRDVVTRDDWPEYPDVRWVPVATATLAEVHAALADGQPYRWYVTITNLRPIGADQ